MTAHPGVDHDAIAERAPLVVDLRGVTRRRSRRHGAALSDAPLTVGVVGLGYWGPNLARNFDAMPSTQLRWCCDGRAEVRDRHARQFP